MRAFVLTNSAGEVVAHVRVEASKSKEIPTPGKIVAPSQHEVHEIEFPEDLYAIKDTGELHRRLKQHLRRS